MKNNVNDCTPAKLSWKGTRMKVRLISFALAFAAVTAAAVWMLWDQAEQAKRALEYTYQRSIADLAVYVDNIDTSLEKTLCAGTSSGAVVQAAKVWREAAAAKACISTLPYSDNRLANTGKFLSQVGEYAYSITNRAATGEEITEDERNNLVKLSEYASSLKEQLYDLLREIAEDDYSIKSVMEELSAEFEEGSGGIFAQMDGSYEDYPTLIYDGPFSDHLENGDAAMLEGLSDITEEEASEKISAIFGDTMEMLGRVNSEIPVYVFADGTKYVEITVKGGRVMNYSDSRDVNGTSYAVGDALNAASAFLSKNGYPDMKYTYYIEDDDSLLINYAYTEDGAVCYADLIKVRIAMDDLSVTGFEAVGYISNHKERDKPSNVIGAEEAMESVSTYLTINGGQMAFICPHELTEYYVYEFNCTAESGRQVLVYIDAVTGREVDILLLLDTPGGTLTV